MSKYKSDPAYQALCQLLTAPTPDLPWESLSPEDWGTLGALARSHGVAPLLHHLSRQHGWVAHLPESLHQFLAREYYASVAHSQIMTTELERVLSTLSAASIPVVVLKGAALAHNLYPDPALRPMNDIDLLVHPEHLFPAIKALKRIGYRQQKITYHAVLAGGQADRTTVEIHWCLLPSAEDGSPPEPWFWEQVLPFQLPSGASGDGSFAFNPGASLLYLCTHLALAHSTADPRLVWLWDIQLFVQHAGAGLDWDELLTAASRFGWSTAMYRSLNAVKEHFIFEIPESASAAAGVKQDQENDLSIQLPLVRDYFRLALASLDCLTRLRVLLGILIPSAEYMKAKYEPDPEFVWIFYYIIRWKNLIRYL